MWLRLIIAILFCASNILAYENGKEKGAVDMAQALFDELCAKGYKEICEELFDDQDY